MDVRTVKKRKEVLSNVYESFSTNNIDSLYKRASETKSLSTVEEVMNNWTHINPNTNIAFTQLVELFDQVSTYAPLGFINKMGNFICEDAIPKVRDGVQTQSYIKRKLGRFKTKLSTKINNNVENMKNAAKQGVTSASSNATKNIQDMKDNISKGLGKDKEDISTDDKVEEATLSIYNKMLSLLEEQRVCDRVLTNYNKLNKKFSIDSILEECSDTQESVLEICKCINHYKIPFEAKYSIALECSLYGLESHHIDYTKKSIASYVTEYFLMNQPIIKNKSISIMEADNLEKMKSIFRSNPFYDDVLPDANTDGMSGTEADIQFDYFFDSEDEKNSTKLFSVKDEEEMALMSEGFVKNGRSKFKPDSNSREGFGNNRSREIREEAYYEAIADIDNVRKIAKNNKMELSQDKDQFIHDIMQAYRIHIREDYGDNSSYYKIFSEEDKSKHYYLFVSFVSSGFGKSEPYCAAAVCSNKKVSEIGLLVLYHLSNPEYVGTLDVIWRKADQKQESMLYDDIDLFVTEGLKDMKKNVKKKGNEVAKLLSEYKTSAQEKTASTCKALVRKIYTKSADNIIEETPNFFTWFRTFFVFSTMAISPLLTIPVAFTDYFIKMSLQRKETEKMIEKYKSELEKAKKAEKKAKKKEDKDRAKQYVETMEKSLEKLETYYDNLLSDKEIEARDAEKYGGDDDFNFESANISYISMIEQSIDTVNTTNSYSILSGVTSHITDFDIEDIDAIMDFIVDTEDIIELSDAIESFEEALDYIRKDRSIDLGYKYTLIDCLQENIFNFRKTLSNRRVIMDAMSESDISKTLNKVEDTTKDIAENTYYKAQFIKAINEMIDLYDTPYKSIHESSISNSLKAASIRLQKAARGLSDKEKAASRTIDSSMASLQKSTEKALTVGNREAVLKGSIIPSASKVIKTAIMTGTAAMIHPALAVIGVLGSLAVSVKFRSKERQLILDEIEIELKMTEKYLKLAEDNNDMQATKQLLMTQRSLERQQQRIKYHMRVHGDNMLTIKDKDNDYVN